MGQLLFLLPESQRRLEAGTHRHLALRLAAYNLGYQDDG